MEDEKQDFKVGDWVVLINNAAGSYNNIGDIGVVRQVEDENRSIKVSVEKNKEQYYNWSFPTDLRLATQEEIYKVSNPSSTSHPQCPIFPLHEDIPNLITSPKPDIEEDRPKRKVYSMELVKRKS